MVVGSTERRKRMIVLLLLVLSWTGISMQTRHFKLCPDKWTHYDTSCYLSNGSAVGLQVASDTCRQKDAHLLFIEDHKEQEFVQGYMDGGVSPVWLGVHYDRSKQKWLWDKDSVTGEQNEVQFNQWSYGVSPPTGGQYCGSVRKDGWWDFVNCSARLPFLCEKTLTCETGWYGGECSEECHCLGSDPCDQRDGRCPRGCRPGWTGASCNIANEMPEASFHCLRTPGNDLRAELLVNVKRRHYRVIQAVDQHGQVLPCRLHRVMQRWNEVFITLLLPGAFADLNGTEGPENGTTSVEEAWESSTSSPEELTSDGAPPPSSQAGESGVLVGSSDGPVDAISLGTTDTASAGTVKMGSAGTVKMGSAGTTVKMSSAGTTVKMSSAGTTVKMGSAGTTVKMSSAGTTVKMSSAGTTVKMSSAGTTVKMSSAGTTVKMSSAGPVDASSVGTMNPNSGTVKMGSAVTTAKMSSAGLVTKKAAEVGESSESDASDVTVSVTADYDTATASEKHDVSADEHVGHDDTDDCVGSRTGNGSVTWLIEFKEFPDVMTGNDFTVEVTCDLDGADRLESLDTVTDDSEKGAPMEATMLPVMTSVYLTDHQTGQVVERFHLGQRLHLHVDVEGLEDHECAFPHSCVVKGPGLQGQEVTILDHHGCGTLEGPVGGLYAFVKGRFASKDFPAFSLGSSSLEVECQVHVEPADARRGQCRHSCRSP